LAGGHINLINIRALLSVYGIILKRLAFHNVAPVTRRVANGEKDRNVSLASGSESFITPWIPVHWVKGVLKKVWTRLIGKAIGFVPVSRRIVMHRVLRLRVRGVTLTTAN
jgi:hypothetical protein